MILQFYGTNNYKKLPIIFEENGFKIGAEFTVMTGKFLSQKIKICVKYMHMNVRYRLTVITYFFCTHIKHTYHQFKCVQRATLRLVLSTNQVRRTEFGKLLVRSLFRAFAEPNWFGELLITNHESVRGSCKNGLAN